MKFSSALYYAIVGIAQIAAHDSLHPLSCPGLCKEFGLSNKFMLLVLVRMTLAGLIVSKRGTTGGYKLAKPAEQISLLEIIEAIDGPLDASTVRAIVFASNAIATIEGALAEAVSD